MAINLGDYYDWAKDPKKELEKQLNKLMSDQPNQDDIDWGKIYDWAREPETPQQPSTTKQDDVDWGKIFDWAKEPEPTPPPEPSTWEKIKSGVSGIFKDKTLKDAGVADFLKYTFYEPLKSIGLDKVPGMGKLLEEGEKGVEQVRAGGGTGMDLQVIQSLTGAGTKMLEETAEKAAEGAKQLGKQLVRDLDAGVADFSKYTFYEPLKSIGVYKIPGVGSVLEKLEEGVDQARAGGGTGIGSQVIRSLPTAGIQAALALMTGGTSLAGQIPATGAEAVRQTATQMLKSPTFTTAALHSYGSGYSEAKEAGADNLQAISAGIQQAIPQAMIEQAGGIEQLGKKAGEGVLRSIGRTALEEAGEEILQYPFEGLAKKATYAPETPWFSTKEQAVINPVQQAQAGLVGGIAGGIFGGIGGAVNALRPDVSIEPVTTDDALPQPDFYVDPYGNVATDSQYRPPLLLPPGPDFQARPETNFYVDQYGNVTTDPNYRPFLQLPAGPEVVQQPAPRPQADFYTDPYGNTMSVIDQAPKLLPAPPKKYAQTNPETVAKFAELDNINRRISEIENDIMRYLDKDSTDSGQELARLQERRSQLEKELQGEKYQATDERFSAIDKLDKDSLEELLKNAEAITESIINDHIEFLKMTSGQGVEQGKVFTNQWGEVVGRHGRISNNEKWYQDWARENGYKKLSKKDLREIAIKHLTEGVDTLTAGYIPPNQNYIYGRDLINYIKMRLNLIDDGPYVANRNIEAPSRVMPGELESLNQQGINPNTQRQSELLNQQPPISNEPDYTRATGERFSPNRLTPANLKALNKRGINPNVTRQSDRLAYLNPPIAQPDYQSAAGQIETPFRLFPGELQETLPPVQTPQEARTDVLDSARPNILPDTETPVKSEIQQPEQTFDTKFTVETDEGVQTYDTNDFVDDAGRTLEAYVNEDPVYRELTEELRGTSAQSDPVIKQIAPEIKDKSGFAYNVDYPQRGLKNVFGKHWDYVKKKYFDPLDKSKGDYAREVTNRVNKIYNEVVQKYGIQKGSRESAAIQWYGEGERIAGSGRNFLSRMFRPEYEVITDEAGREIRVPKMEKYTLEDLKREFPNKWRDIVEAEKVFRQQYDELIDLINESRKKVYPAVEKQIEGTRQRIRDISQDIKELQRKLKDKNLATNERKDIQRRIDDMNAKREELSNKLESGELWRNKRVPKRKNYFRHFRELTSGIGGLANILASPYQIDPQLAGISEFTKPKSRWASFMQQRGLGEYTADAVGGFLDYIRPAAYAIHIDPHITKIRQLAKDIADATQNTRNANNLIIFLNDYANSLAGKTSRFDRLIQDMIPGGRKAFAVINWLNKRARANAVLGNLRSSITQIANIPAGISEVADPVALTKGMGETLVNILGGGRRAIEQSDFIAERYMDSVFDKFDTRLINKPKQFAAWLLGAGDELGTRFTWNSAYYKALKKGIENPIKYADDLTRNVVAGRGVGETPLIQQSKLFQLFFPFTLEIGNVAHVMKNQIKGKEFGKFITFLIANWLFNELFESTYGDRPLLDPIDAMADVLTEDDPNFMKVAGRLGGEVLSNIPMGQTVASLWPQYETDVTTPFGGYTIPSRRELFGDADPTRYGTGFLLQEAIQDPFYKLLPPWGGGQLKKTLEGLQTLEEGGYIKDDKLRYLVPPTPENIAKSLLFGRSATPEAREYFEKGRRPLSEQQTQSVLQSRDPKEQYRIFMLQREAKRIQEQMKEVNRNPDLTTAEKDKRIRELQQKLNKLWATEQ